MLVVFFAEAVKGTELPSVIAGASFSLRGAAVAMPVTADRATRDDENFILAIEGVVRRGELEESDVRESDGR